MRLICPNCDAQYEVPDEVMPQAGRDVQCSNCGQTWFQHHPDNTPDADEDAALEADAPAPDEETAPPPPPPAPPQPAPERRQLDPEVADILRQEAEAEHEARRARASDPLESQPDLGLDEGDGGDDEAERRAREARIRMARMRGEPEPVSDAAANAAAVSSRRDLLPDIEEINSTLRNDSDRTGNSADNTSALDDPAKPRKSGSFRRGFGLMLLLAAVMALVYAYAPQIARTVPQVDPVLSSYVTWMDQMRLWLDGHLQSALIWLDTMASKSQG
tara:strand:- start:91362 stop:92183 length:822 start_codon:yes stop_codon:yes gene_type:complete